MNRIEHLMHRYHENDDVKAEKRLKRAKKLRRKMKRSAERRAVSGR